MSIIKQKEDESLTALGLRKLKSNPLAVVFIGFSIVVMYYANQFPSGGERVGPAAFPILICIGIIVFAAVDIVTGGETELEMSEYDFTPPAILFGLLVAYLLLMPILGFLVSTILYMPTMLYYSKIRSKPLIVAFTLGVPILLFYIFARIFLIRLPEGIIPISRLLPVLPVGVMV